MPQPLARKELIAHLRGNPLPASQIARLAQLRMKDLQSELDHILLTLRHSPMKADITPARCKKCGFEFGLEKLTKPSKCPKCHGTWISEPCIGISDRPSTGA